MLTLHDAAQEHIRLRTGLTDRVTSRMLRLWAHFDLSNLDSSWDLLAPRMVAEAVAAQVTAARQTTPYLNRVTAGDAPRPVPEAFAGVTLDGRELAPAMYGAVTTTKRVIAAGRPPQEAFTVGASFLATVVGAAVQDMGRQADMVGAVGRGWTRYVRALSPGACSRCAILAGKGSTAVPFKRHPRCKCVACPVPVDPTTGRELAVEGFFDTPGDYFDSLSRGEQDRVFTNAGAEAIRQGADPVKVVNARRGAYGIGYSGHYNVHAKVNRLRPVTVGVRADGTPLRVYATTEGTTGRGGFGRNELQLTDQYARDGRYRRTTTIRLMPEQIAVMAGDDPDRWIELLTRYGYLY